MNEIEIRSYIPRELVEKVNGFADRVQKRDLNGLEINDVICPDPAVLRSYIFVENLTEIIGGKTVVEYITSHLGECEGCTDDATEMGSYI